MSISGIAGLGEVPKSDSNDGTVRVAPVPAASAPRAETESDLTKLTLPAVEVLNAPPFAHLRTMRMWEPPSGFGVNAEPLQSPRLLRRRRLRTPVPPWYASPHAEAPPGPWKRAIWSTARRSAPESCDVGTNASIVSRSLFVNAVSTCASKSMRRAFEPENCDPAVRMRLLAHVSPLTPPNEPVAIVPSQVSEAEPVTLE